MIARCSIRLSTLRRLSVSVKSLQRSRKRVDAGSPPFQHRGHHTIIALAHLLGGEQVLRVGGKARVDDCGDLRMLREKHGDVHRVAAVTLHPQRDPRRP
jgi:hypothetical protein